jgi:hypothetical protein
MRTRRRLSVLTLLAPVALVALAGSACTVRDLRGVIYYDLVGVPESQPTQHYQQFVDAHGGIVDIGCFVVQKRQTNCFDNAGTGQPNLHLGVVECTCPCTEEIADPCDPTRPKVRAGTVRGVVGQVLGPLFLGGVEEPVEIDLADATRLFITLEENADTSPSPSANVVLEGELHKDGEVVNGLLSSPTPAATSGRVTIVPATDEVSL